MFRHETPLDVLSVPEIAHQKPAYTRRVEHHSEYFRVS